MTRIATDGPPIGRNFSGSPGKALFGATVGFFIGFGAVSLFGPTAHSFIEVMKLTPGQVGILVAIPMLTGSLLRIPFGAWVDNNGGKLPFLILLLLSVVGIAGLYWLLITRYPDHLGQAQYPWLLLFGALGGCGIASFSVGIGQVSYWFPKNRQGWALGTYAGTRQHFPGPRRHHTAPDHRVLGALVCLSRFDSDRRRRNRPLPRARSQRTLFPASS